jgi:small-conductance mechanosensitive channel
MADTPSARRHTTQKLGLLALLAGAITGFFLQDRVSFGDPQLVRTSLYFLASFSAIQLLDLWALRPLVERTGTPGLFHTIIKVLVYAAVSFTILRTQYGFDIVPLLTTSAVLSFVLGLALQDTLGNFFAGITINIEKPYKVGDWVKIGETEGQVVNMSWRTTKLLSPVNTCLTIPNNTIAKDTIVNFSAPYGLTLYRILIDLGYDTAPNIGREVILQTLRAIPEIPTIRPPEVQVVDFRDFSVQYAIRLWLPDWRARVAIEDIVRRRLWYAFKRQNLIIPYPTSEIYLRKAPPADQLALESKLRTLRAVPLFAPLDPATLREAAAALTEQVYAQGEPIVEEGTAGDSLQILTAGSVSIEKQGQTVASLQPGSFFGEMSLLTGERRSATVRAATDCTTLELGKNAFAAVVASRPEILERLSEIIAARQQENLQHHAQTQSAATAEGAGPRHGDGLKHRVLSMMRSFLR